MKLNTESSSESQSQISFVTGKNHHSISQWIFLTFLRKTMIVMVIVTHITELLINIKYIIGNNCTPVCVKAINLTTNTIIATKKGAQYHVVPLFVPNFWGHHKYYGQIWSYNKFSILQVRIFRIILYLIWDIIILLSKTAFTDTGIIKIICARHLFCTANMR